MEKISLEPLITIVGVFSIIILFLYMVGVVLKALSGRHYGGSDSSSTKSNEKMSTVDYFKGVRTSGQPSAEMKRYTKEDGSVFFAAVAGIQASEQAHHHHSGGSSSHHHDSGGSSSHHHDSSGSSHSYHHGDNGSGHSSGGSEW